MDSATGLVDKLGGGQFLILALLWTAGFELERIMLGRFD